MKTRKIRLYLSLTFAFAICLVIFALYIFQTPLASVILIVFIFGEVMNIEELLAKLTEKLLCSSPGCAAELAVREIVASNFGMFLIILFNFLSLALLIYSTFWSLEKLSYLKATNNSESKRFD